MGDRKGQSYSGVGRHVFLFHFLDSQFLLVSMWVFTQLARFCKILNKAPIQRVSNDCPVLQFSWILFTSLPPQHSWALRGLGNPNWASLFAAEFLVLSGCLACGNEQRSYYCSLNYSVMARSLSKWVYCTDTGKYPSHPAAWRHQESLSWSLAACTLHLPRPVTDGHLLFWDPSHQTFSKMCCEALNSMFDMTFCFFFPYTVFCFLHRILSGVCLQMLDLDYLGWGSREQKMKQVIGTVTVRITSISHSISNKIKWNSRYKSQEGQFGLDTFWTHVLKQWGGSGFGWGTPLLAEAW